MSLPKANPKRANRIDKGAIEAARTGVKAKKKRSVKTIHDSCERLAVAHCNQTHEGCQAAGYVTKNCPSMRCSDRMERAHLISRGEKYIQFRPDNTTLLCNIHHRHFSKHPHAWTDFINAKYPGRWDDLDAILLERKHTRVKEPLDEVYAAWEAWYKAGGDPAEMPYLAPSQRLEVLQ